MSNKNAKNEKSRFSKICSILTDILVFPVIIIAFACAIFMSSAKANNKVPSIFGNSIVEVLTGSMDLGTPQSYKPGDILIINQNISLDNVAVGDCLAFYAPKESGFTDDNGNSLIIFHRVVRIVYVKVDDVNKRYFVCHGDAAGALELIPAQNIDESTHDIDGNVQKGGGYVVKLFDDDVPATNQDNKLPTTQSQLQYVADEFVIGSLKSRASGLVTGLVKFCTSPAGITAMVIIPSVIMIVFVVLNMINESKQAKKENEDDSLVFAQNMVGAESANIELNAKTAEPKDATPTKPEKKSIPAKEQPAKDIKVAPKPESQTTNTAKVTAKPTPVKQESPKAVPVKEPTKAVPEKKTTPTKSAPKPEAPTPKPAQPKPVAPKATPAKPEAQKTAPVKPSVPPTAPTSKTPPAKVPPKKS